ncbi:hypothetical protein RE428_08100 [Marinobacter nanhaiticus D15-8W]|nr:hypothetical protein RE428_08100 [Marinobacter nanhaiticus D15-8W]
MGRDAYRWFVRESHPHTVRQGNNRCLDAKWGYVLCHVKVNWMQAASFKSFRWISGAAQNGLAPWIQV